jgi:hypothetical protein
MKYLGPPDRVWRVEIIYNMARSGMKYGPPDRKPTSQILLGQIHLHPINMNPTACIAHAKGYAKLYSLPSIGNRRSQGSLPHLNLSLSHPTGSATLPTVATMAGAPRFLVRRTKLQFKGPYTMPYSRRARWKGAHRGYTC